VPIYDLRCANGHTVEVIQSFTAALPPCPACGGATSKVPSRFGIGGRATTPPAPELMPQTWRGTYAGDRDYVTSLRRTAEQRQTFEQRHPEEAGDRRPVVAHEGRFEGAPLRRGDPVPPDPGAGTPHPGPHGHSHAHGHGHAHGHPHGDGASEPHSPPGATGAGRPPRVG
jgi:putative FmdB family regulatory protein